MNQQPSTTSQVWYHRPSVIALILFGLALLPRLPGLSRFLTSDENTNIFFAGSDVIAAFLQGDLRGTYWHFYPGVTMSWLDAVGMAGQYLLESLIGRPVPTFTEYIYGDILSLVVANRLPYAILTAAAVSSIYLLARNLISHRVALFGALLMAFDPFYLAHSRVAHGDAPVAVFMTLSALTLFVYAEQVKIEQGSASVWVVFRQKATLYLVASAIFGSLAALTKAPGQFMALFVIVMALIYAILDLRARNVSMADITVIEIIRHWSLVVLLWAGVSLVVFFLTWPSMWVDPIGTFRQMWAETFGKVNEGHLVYFLGQPTLDPGFWFYFYVIPFRLTPVILIGGLLSLLYLFPGLKSLLPTFTDATDKPRQTRLSPLVLLWFFTITLLLFGNLSPKKQDRYLLPLFPFLNLIAAMGWLGTINLVYALLKSKIQNPKLRLSEVDASPFPPFLSPLTIYLALLLLHLIPTLTYYPYYLTYFNPVMGGPTRAAETTLMGWGEGMEQVAAYLNTKPNAAQLYVASTPSQTLLPYFAGTGENFYTNDIAFRADYVVLYLAQMQRLAPSPEIVRYFAEQQPETVINIQGVPYAKIYPGPKLILPDIPAEATPLNIGLADTMRLAGYQRSESPNTRHPTLTLYWHALAALPLDYTISVRARAADGLLLIQQDSWPVAGLLPTSQWRQGDYVVDRHTLELPAETVVMLDHFEVVVYHLETGQALGAPLIIPASENPGS